MSVEIREGRMIAEARCTACGKELTVETDDPRLARREIDRFQKKHGGDRHEKSSYRSI